MSMNVFFVGVSPQEMPEAGPPAGKVYMFLTSEKSKGGTLILV